MLRDAVGRLGGILRGDFEVLDLDRRRPTVTTMAATTATSDAHATTMSAICHVDTDDDDVEEDSVFSLAPPLASLPAPSNDGGAIPSLLLVELVVVVAVSVVRVMMVRV
jgi:hypothetical protein